jgi:hypothetical protein
VAHTLKFMDAAEALGRDNSMDASIKGDVWAA